MTTPNVPATSSGPFSLELVEKAVPPNLKASVTQALVDRLNNISTDQLLAENIRENFISYSSVLREGRYKLEDYMNAVTYCAHKVMGSSNQDAYFKTFPHRYQNLLSMGKTPKEISSYVAAYAKNQLVNKVLEQSLVPSWILNQDMFQKALNVNYEIMNDPDVSPKVRVEAANSLLTHLAKPKESAATVNIDLRENSGLNELKDALQKMASQQQDMIRNGMSTKDVAAQQIIDVEAKE